MLQHCCIIVVVQDHSSEQSPKARRHRLTWMFYVDWTMFHFNSKEAVGLIYQQTRRINWALRFLE